MIPDFAIYYDPDKDTGVDIFRKIIFSVIYKRVKANYPCVIFVSGGSGSGKSETVLFAQKELSKMFGWDIHEHVNNVNIYTPMQYSEKMQALLKDKKLKKVNIAAIHEARVLVNSKNWQSFTNQSVAHVNAMSRSIKRIVFFIVSQYIRDISTDIRYTLNHYWRIAREKGKPVKLYWDVMYNDDRDLEKPKLRKRKLRGYLIDPKGKYIPFTPDYFEIPRVEKELRDIMIEADKDAKVNIIEQRLDDLFKEMSLEGDDKSTAKINSMVEWYTKSPDRLMQLGKFYRKKWKLDKSAIDRHDLNKKEAKRVEELITAKVHNDASMTERVE